MGPSGRNDSAPGPGRPRGRALAVAFCVAALGVGVTVIALLGGRILETWHLRRFSEGDRATKPDAARRLSRMQSPRAAFLLVEEIATGMHAEMKRHELWIGDPRGLLGDYEKELLDDLIAIGKPALPALVAALAPSEEPYRSIVARWTLETIDPRFVPRRERKTDEPAHYTGLRELAQDPAEDPALRSLASSTLLRLEERWRGKRIFR